MMFTSDKKEDRLLEMEEYIWNNLDAVRNYPDIDNLPSYSDNPNYKAQLQKLNYENYIQKGDIHYFFSRVLFLYKVKFYSYFSAQQCVECYLKAFINFKNKKVPEVHNLEKILIECRNIQNPIEPFINSDHLEAIIRKYNPFNELPRYPIYKHGPKKSGFVSWYPHDIYFLDYFVYKMREIFLISNNSLDILKNIDFELDETKTEFPDFYNIFTLENINFYTK